MDEQSPCFFDLVETLYDLKLSLIKDGQACYIAQYPTFRVDISSLPDTAFYHEGMFLTYAEWLDKLLVKLWKKREAFLAEALKGE